MWHIHANLFRKTAPSHFYFHYVSATAAPAAAMVAIISNLPPHNMVFWWKDSIQMANPTNFKVKQKTKNKNRELLMLAAFWQSPTMKHKYIVYNTHAIKTKFKHTKKQRIHTRKMGENIKNNIAIESYVNSRQGDQKKKEHVINHHFWELCSSFFSCVIDTQVFGLMKKQTAKVFFYSNFNRVSWMRNVCKCSLVNVKRFLFCRIHQTDI